MAAVVSFLLLLTLKTNGTHAFLRMPVSVVLDMASGDLRSG